MRNDHTSAFYQLSPITTTRM